MSVLTVQHDEMACYGSKNHCCWHYVDEPDQGAFRCCLECRHVYMSPEDLIAAWTAEWGPSVRWAGNPQLIPGCAFCGHDWVLAVEESGHVHVWLWDGIDEQEVPFDAARAGIFSVQDVQYRWVEHQRCECGEERQVPLA